MKIIVDTHAHFYDLYDPASFLRAAIKNLASVVPSESNAEEIGFAICLCERSGQNSFNALFSDRNALERIGWKPEIIDADLIKVVDNDGAKLYVLNGRQFVSSEKIEILALGYGNQLQDGLSARELLTKVNVGGGVPVLSWSPGKWMFKRGEVIRQLMADWNINKFVLGDVAIRSHLFPVPEAFKNAENCNIAIIAGSDPLPFAGEQTMVGRYATLLEIPDMSGADLRDALWHGGRNCGDRNGPIKALLRLINANLNRR